MWAAHNTTGLGGSQVCSIPRQKSPPVVRWWLRKLHWLGGPVTSDGWAVGGGRWAVEWVGGPVIELARGWVVVGTAPNQSAVAISSTFASQLCSHYRRHHAGVGRMAIANQLATTCYLFHCVSLPSSPVHIALGKAGCSSWSATEDVSCQRNTSRVPTNTAHCIVT